jgi:hypothetical protein
MSTQADIRHAGAIAVELGFPENSPHRQLLLAVALIESDFGLTGQFAGTNNWGAIVATPAEPGFLGRDTDDKGNPIVSRFAVYPSQIEGASALVRTLSHYPPAFDEMQKGNTRGLARAMYGSPGHRFYTGKEGSDEARISFYANALQGAVVRIAAALGERPLARLGSGGSGTFILGVGAALLLWWWLK